MSTFVIAMKFGHIRLNLEQLELLHALLGKRKWKWHSQSQDLQTATWTKGSLLLRKRVLYLGCCEKHTLSSQFTEPEVHRSLPFSPENRPPESGTKSSLQQPGETWAFPVRATWDDTHFFTANSVVKASENAYQYLSCHLGIPLWDH